MFFRGSRYATVKEHEIADETGRVIRYKAIRFSPPTRVQGSHVVREDDRLDRIAHQHLRAPQRFWRICDANGALWPGDLLAEPGRTLLIPPTSEA
jgi:hypothetical protein